MAVLGLLQPERVGKRGNRRILKAAECLSQIQKFSAYPARLPFFEFTLKEIFCVSNPVIKKPMH